MEPVPQQVYQTNLPLELELKCLNHQVNSTLFRHVSFMMRKRFCTSNSPGVEPNNPPAAGAGDDPNNPPVNGAGALDPNNPPEAGAGVDPNNPPAAGAGVDPNNPPAAGVAAAGATGASAFAANLSSIIF
jgi:hypothetical protein